MSSPNYKDFYQKSLISIGTNDFIHFKEAVECDHFKHSHWLIALEGQLKEIENEYYCWKVTVYPSDSNGCFSWKSSCYTSSIYDCFHQAYNHANDIEKHGKNDQFFGSNIRESVS